MPGIRGRVGGDGHPDPQAAGGGLSTEEIAFLQPCVHGVAPDLEPCVELLTALRQRRSKLDRQIDALTRSREALDAYIRVTEQNTDPLAPSTCATR